MTNNENENLRTRIVNIITSTIAKYPGQVEIDHTTIDDDDEIIITSQSPNRHALNVRIEPSGLLVDVDESQAFELSFADNNDIEDFSSIVRSFCDGSLEILRGADGIYYGIRGAGFELLTSSSMLQLFRAKPRKWVLLGQLPHE